MEDTDSPPGEDPKREYADERDMERFWEVARLEREPARQWWYIPLIVALIFWSIPWGGIQLPDFELEFGNYYLVTAPEIHSVFNYEAIILGLPVWIWIPLGCTLGLSVLTAFAILRFWGDGDSDSD